MWRKDTSRIFRLVNFELYAKPNVTVGLLGTGAFVGILSVLFWQKRQFDLRENKAKVVQAESMKTFHEEE